MRVGEDRRRVRDRWRAETEKFDAVVPAAYYLKACLNGSALVQAKFWLSPANSTVCFVSRSSCLFRVRRPRLHQIGRLFGVRETVSKFERGFCICLHHIN